MAVTVVFHASQYDQRRCPVTVACWQSGADAHAAVTAIAAWLRRQAVVVRGTCVPTQAAHFVNRNFESFLCCFRRRQACL